MGVHAHGIEYVGVLCEASPAPAYNPGVDIPLTDGDVAMNEEFNLTLHEDHNTYTGNELVLDIDGQWKRRRRLVAREFRSGAQSTEETFAPTSSKYVVDNLLILWLIHQLAILLNDSKDTFLTVAQGELVIAEVPEWIKSEESSHFWKLCRCETGQRRAALQKLERLF